MKLAAPMWRPADALLLPDSFDDFRGNPCETAPFSPQQAFNTLWFHHWDAGWYRPGDGCCCHDATKAMYATDVGHCRIHALGDPHVATFAFIHVRTKTAQSQRQTPRNVGQSSEADFAED
jgi:hypothetical protein